MSVAVVVVAIGKHTQVMHGKQYDRRRHTDDNVDDDDDANENMGNNTSMNLRNHATLSRSLQIAHEQASRS